MHRLRALPASLWDSLFNIEQPPARYLGCALLVDLPVTILIAIGVSLAFPDSGPDFSPIPHSVLLAIVCVLGPAIETLLMGVIFYLLRFRVHNTATLAMISALVWAGLHSLGAPSHGLVIFWPFLIFSICYLRWETRSWGHAFLMTWLLHALHNLLPGIAILLEPTG